MSFKNFSSTLKTPKSEKPENSPGSASSKGQPAAQPNKAPEPVAPSDNP